MTINKKLNLLADLYLDYELLETRKKEKLKVINSILDKLKYEDGLDYKGICFMVACRVLEIEKKNLEDFKHDDETFCS